MRDYRAIRAQRVARDKAAAKRRSNEEAKRLRSAATSLSGPFGYGPLWESLAPARHTSTPEPWDPSRPPWMPE